MHGLSVVYQFLLVVAPVPPSSTCVDAAAGWRHAFGPGAAGCQEGMLPVPLHPQLPSDTGIQAHQKGHGGQ